MELPELRMTFADQTSLAHELQQNLRHGRAFLYQHTEIPVLSECMLVLVHPEREEELHLPAQVVMVNAGGVGVSLASGYLTQLDQLEAFAAPSMRLDTFVPEPPSDADGAGDLDPEQRMDTWVPQAPAERLGHAPLLATMPPPPAFAATSGSDADPSSDDRPTYIPGEPELAAAGLSTPGLVGEPSQPPAAAASITTPAYLEIGEPAPELAPETAAPETETETEPVDEASFADVAEELTRDRPALAGQAQAEPESDTVPPTAADDDLGDMEDAPIEEEELNSDLMTPSGRPARPRDVQLENRQERLRGLNAAQQLKVARTGELADRIAVERLYGKQVWESLLHNPRMSIPEVARIARKGTVPKPLLEVILDNAGWIKADAVRRALLSNPKLGAEAVLKLLRATPKHELKMIEKGTAYGVAVRDAARKLLRQ